MGKINKFANLYNIDGTLLRKVNHDGVLDDYTIPELEDLVDQLSEDKDENGHVRNPRTLNNVNSVLMHMYQKYGIPEDSNLIKKLKESLVINRNTKEQVEEKLNETMKELSENEEADGSEIVHRVKSNLDPEYVEFEEIKE